MLFDAHARQTVHAGKQSIHYSQLRADGIETQRNYEKSRRPDISTHRLVGINGNGTIRSRGVVKIWPKVSTSRQRARGRIKPAISVFCPH
ncbi:MULTISPECIES: hypothetical protein [Burkholderia]|uniref:hypothetical protein n=1 Tax=Burkholderia TaxID=32008 RepID=UPI0011AFFBAC|nr:MULTISPECIES: hypothetical protein [Burkholderia]MCA8242895.1 hypothetical protein [Burkholderia sp. AU32262]MDF3091639.1 hypothetical protein [Burkholderia semiarida]MDF3107150.1 hypothetical protein [Burkholderia semiarida]